MKKFATLVGMMLVLPVATSSLVSCRKASEVLEASGEEIAEALANQAISGYHTAAVDVTINNHSFSVACAEGGTLDWSEKDENGTICYSTDAKSCSFTVGSKTLTLSGPYKVCGFPVPAEDSDGASDLVGKTLTVTGSISASGETSSGETLTSRSCDYDLTLSNIAVSGSDNSLTVATDISGTMCGDHGFSVSTSFSVSGSISAE
jgi:hypothetical protein